MLTQELWRKANILWKKHLELKGRPIGRKKLAELLEISDSLAREILFALKHRELLTVGIEHYETETREVELVLADLHIPFHDMSAIETIFTYLEEEKVTPTVVTLLGDVVDFYKISKFPGAKNPRKKGVKEELDTAKRFLETLRNKFPDAKIIYYEGNHEKRLTRYIVDNASEIYELVADLLEEKLGLEELDIEYKSSPFRVGKLWHLHGHERPTSSYNPEYITNVIWKYVHDHFIVGHYHRNQEKVFKRIDGQLYWGGAVGHLAVSFDYAVLNNWTQGFCVVKYDKLGRFKAEVKTVYQGEVY